MKDLTNNDETNRKVIDLIAKLKALDQPFLSDTEDEPADEYAHFYFIGDHEGQEVLFDTVLYTLRLQHESELFEIAEQRAAEQFPNYQKIQFDENENDPDNLESEIGLYMAGVMVELEEEDEVKVKEHVDLDLEHDCGIGLDVGLHIDKVTPTIIKRFIADFNSDKLELDPGLYSFQTQSESEKP